MANENENKLNEVIKAFADAGFIDDVILIGSWRLSFYDVFSRVLYHSKTGIVRNAAVWTFFDRNANKLMAIHGSRRG